MCAASPEARRDHALRQLVQRMLTDSYGLASDDAWILERLSVRLGELLTGNSDLVRTASLRDDAGRWKVGENVGTCGSRRAGIQPRGRPALRRPRELLETELGLKARRAPVALGPGGGAVAVRTTVRVLLRLQRVGSSCGRPGPFRKVRANSRAEFVVAV